MIYFVGIDPAAESFVATVRTAEAEVVCPKRFDNSSEGIAALADWLKEASLRRAETLVCVENTGVYSELLCYELDAAGYAVSLLDPHKVWKAFGDGPKTDPIDAGKIAEYGYRYYDRLVRWAPHGAIVEQVKVLLATREQFVEQKVEAQNTLSMLRRKYIQTPPANSALEETVAYLHQKIREIESELKRLIGEHPTAAQMVALLMTAPGVRLLLASHLFVITAGFTRKVSYRSLAQYLGIAPNARQSGTSLRKRSRSRGYGPSTMRKLLHLAARSIRTHHPGYRAYFLRKVAEGKPKTLVLNNLANRLLRVLCAMINQRQPYIEGHQSIHPRLLCS